MRVLAGFHSGQCALVLFTALQFLAPAALAAIPTRGNHAADPGRAAPPISPPPAVSIPPGVRTGWPVNLHAPDVGFPYTPSLIDVDQDGAMEIFVTGQETFGLKGDGNFVPGWPTTELPFGTTYQTNDQKPGPSGADVDGDGQVEVMWSLRDWGDYIWCFNGREANGQNMPGFPQHGQGNAPEAFFVPFVLGDSDGDGAMEAWGAYSRSWDSFVMNRMSAFDHLGNRRFIRDFDPTEDILDLYYGDVDGGGHNEFMAVTNLAHVLKLYVFLPDGTSPGFPSVLANLAGSDLQWGPPVAVDVDHDGDLEFLMGYTDDAGSHVLASRYYGGAVPGFPLDIAAQSWIMGISLGDLTGDGEPELIATDFDPQSSAFRVYAFSLSTGALMPGWPYSLQSWPHGVPVVADVDGDGRQDVCVSTDAGQVYAINPQGALVPGFPKNMHFGSISGAAVGDIDGDGLFEIVCSTWDGWVYAWDTTGPAIPGRADWPTRGIDPRNTGVFHIQPSSGVSTSISVRPRLRGSPNPVLTTAEFSISGSWDGTDVALFDAGGRRVDSVTLREGRAQWRPDAALPPGVYFVRADHGNERLRATLVRVR